MERAELPLGAEWSVVCLCADWCGVCQQYRAVFEGVAARHPGVGFHWVDIEDEAEAMGDVDVETFPTLLIAHASTARHLGPMTPHPEVLARRLADLQTAPASAPACSAEAQELWGRIQGVLAGRLQKNEA